MQNFGKENFDDSTCIRQNSSDFSTVKVLRYTVCVCACMLVLENQIVVASWAEL